MSVRPAALFPTGSARQALAPDACYPPAFLHLLGRNDLDEGHAFLAWQLAQLAGDLSDDERDGFMLLVGRLLAAEALGSTRLALDSQDERILDRVPALVGSPAAHTPLVRDGGHLYSQRSFFCETRVATRLRTRLASGSAFSQASIRDVLAQVAATTVPSPSDEQREAAISALCRAIGIITGGPGTGKTTLALMLIRSLVRLGVSPASIAVAAPTGKAASRLADDIHARLGLLDQAAEPDRSLFADCPAPQTLHRLLGIGGRARPVPAELLPWRAVVVDEASMIDIGLMDRLLAALPDDTLLVLLGDADQLPSVASGAVFRDLAPFAQRLARPFRTDPSRPEGQQLAALAQAVRAGDVAALALCSPRPRPDDIQGAGAEWILPEHREQALRRYYRRQRGDKAVRALVEHVYPLRDGLVVEQEAAKLDALAAHLACARVLAVTQRRAEGVESANAFVHDLYGGGPSFWPGEPTLVLRNDYELGLWNGDQGIAIRVRWPDGAVALAVAFRSASGWKVVDPQAMEGAIALGHALTVHKAQGSEFDEVLLILPDDDCPLLTRELFYTAISRARRNVVVCGAATAMRAAITTTGSRSSGLAERLT